MSGYDLALSESVDYGLEAQEAALVEQSELIRNEQKYCHRIRSEEKLCERWRFGAREDAIYERRKKHLGTCEHDHR